jgi:hypothetical protein
MKQELLCSWLGLPNSAWPPDPRTLLGIKGDEHDLGVIEKRVHECMTRLRTYQLSYPEEATEGMNRLAEAFITLTETCSKAGNGTPTATAPAAKEEPAGADWHEAPPVREDTAEVLEVLKEDDAKPSEVMVAQPFAAPAKPIRRVIDAALLKELAEESDEATSNLATLEAIVERVDQTRILLHNWDLLGRHLRKHATVKITPKENELFTARLEKVRQAMERYPAFLGQPGKPGYRIVVQARLKVPLVMVRNLNVEQREELLFDWQAGRQVLLTHRKFLLRLFKSMRHRTAFGLFVHAARSLVNDHPLLALTGALLVLVLIVGGGFVLRCMR